MSEKISSKNLCYDSKVPPFLRTLHAQAAGNALGPDPILSKRRRAGKKRAESEEAEDAPLVLDDEGNIIDVRVDQDGGVEESQLNKHEIEKKETQKDEKREAEKVAGIGASKKRKAGKVIGDGAGDSKTGGQGEAQDKARDEGGSRKKAGRKTGKKIKLSFDEPE